MAFLCVTRRNNGVRKKGKKKGENILILQSFYLRMYIWKKKKKELNIFYSSVFSATFSSWRGRIYIFLFVKRVLLNSTFESISTLYIMLYVLLYLLTVNNKKFGMGLLEWRRKNFYCKLGRCWLKRKKNL